MITTYNTYQNHDIQMLIWKSISQLDKYQQIKLLEFINSLFLNVKQETNKLLKYEGCIAKDELELMKTAISDCEKIDNNEW
jgi:hypothetical protein